jgi:excinuclease ABC subunit B
MYADHITDSMEKAITETERRRSIQDNYNKAHGIIPKTIIKEIRDLISNIDDSEKKTKISKKERMDNINKIEEEMRKAAKELDFERAMELRDIWLEMKSE